MTKNNIIKYFVYKGTGGLFHNLRGLSEAIRLSILNEVTLIIDMDRHSAFGGNFNDYFTIECNKLKYSCNYENISLPENLKNIQSGYFGYNGKNNNYKIDYKKEINILYGPTHRALSHRPLYKKIQVNTVYFKNIQLKNPIIKNKYISVHFRNSDIKNDTNLFLKKITNILNKYNNIDTIYIASDDYDFYNIVQNKFPNINIIRKTFFEKNLKNLHYGSKDKKKQMYDCLVDIYYILLSDVFIPCFNSGMSKCIINMIQDNYTIFPNILSKTIIDRTQGI